MSNGFQRKHNRSNHFRSNPLPIRQLLQKYQIGQKVVLKLNGTYFKGRFHYRYHGHIGYILKQLGLMSYMISTQDSKVKLIVNTAHIKNHIS